MDNLSEELEKKVNMVYDELINTLDRDGARRSKNNIEDAKIRIIHGSAVAKLFAVVLASMKEESRELLISMVRNTVETLTQEAGENSEEEENKDIKLADSPS